jgi:formylglycine-generating enzyme required for sulfatase activity
VFGNQTDADARRLSRGGSWVSLASHCQIPYRSSCWPNSRGYGAGFRVCTVPARPCTPS